MGGWDIPLDPRGSEVRPGGSGGDSEDGAHG